ncbi:MAG: inorganic pyrophosphatase [Candidatus Harrisonbacteria bacterium CG10_big_fil_rev_8_21_14_0_10_38_8]|uniref:Inorganic pyrophosphatase n=1 Tax=Candidatus Harrisonbacteria bacterium CG10_big_fil_rev_8_21_14_0_10_38_8 TaxID=1974582 RepID=A0A2M6WJF0_9BACT|nr:MAG: inorganic pyrophosphatase [Candidatus Harrisonbacteria bacterium CG10_big_fil_rev_8_21_14_0_10_38_8]
MNNHFHTIKQEKAPEYLNLIVEITKGERNKYEYNKDLGLLELDRVLHGPTVFPVNYCDVPNTWNEYDNDPLDAVVFNSTEILPGVLVRGRVVGVMEMIDNGEQDHKILCVNDKDPRYDHVKTFKDLTPYEMKDLKTFFEIYKIAQTGPDTVKVGEFHGLEKAYELIKESMVAYTKKFNS